MAVANGVYTLTATALDTSGNPASHAISVTVANPPSINTMTCASCPKIAYNMPSPIISVNGAGFTNNSDIVVGAAAPQQVTIANPTFTNGSLLQFQLTQTQTLTLGVGQHPVVVQNGSQTSNAVSLEIAPPILNSIQPTTILLGANAVIDFNVSLPGLAPCQDRHC